MLPFRVVKIEIESVLAPMLPDKLASERAPLLPAKVVVEMKAISVSANVICLKRFMCVSW